LGLAISQEYTRLLGGNITVESRIGQGSSFVLEVPVEPVLDAESAQHKFKGSSLRLAPGSAGCRVLVVDDLVISTR